MKDETGFIRKGFVRYGEFLVLRNKIRDHQKVALTIGFWYGFRKEEVLTLRWDQIDFDDGTIRLLKSKNEEGRVVPLLDDARASWRSRATRTVRYSTDTTSCWKKSSWLACPTRRRRSRRCKRRS